MEPVGIYSAVAISKEQLERFYAEQGAALADDIRCILGTKPGLVKEPYGGFVDPATSYFHDPRNALVIRYDDDTGMLFFLYQLEVRNPDAMKRAPAFSVFARIIDYVDTDLAGYIAFSASSPNFLTDELWVAYEVRKEGLREIAADGIPAEQMSTLDRLSWRYYWGLIDSLYRNGEEDQSGKNFYPQQCVDAGVLQTLGMEAPTDALRIVASPYPRK